MYTVDQYVYYTFGHDTGLHLIWQPTLIWQTPVRVSEDNCKVSQIIYLSPVHFLDLQWSKGFNYKSSSNHTVSYDLLSYFALSIFPSTPASFLSKLYAAVCMLTDAHI